MAKVIKKRIKFVPSDGVDVVAHRVYIAPDPDELTYASLHVDVPVPESELIVPDEFPGFPMRDVMYSVGVTAIDDVGNESDMAVILAPFDFDAPPAPAGVVIEDV